MNKELIKKGSTGIMVIGTLMVITIPILKIYNKMVEGNHFVSILEEGEFISLIGMGLWAVGFGMVMNKKENN